MKPVKVLIFDTETAGLPKQYIPAEQDINNYPPVLQFAGQLVEINKEDGKYFFREIITVNSFIEPIRNGETITIHEKAQQVHGISVKQLEHFGIPLHTVIMSFQGLLQSANIIVAHNFDFDRNMMVSECLREGYKPHYRKTTRILCTMKYLTNKLQIPNKGKGKGFKYPKLEEAFLKVVGDDMYKYFKAHDALEDVKATVILLVNMLNTIPEFAETFEKPNETFKYFTN